MSNLLDMSLDDLIRKGKENGGRDSNFRGRGAGSGSVLGPGPDRWVFRRDPARHQPYSVRPVKLMQVQQEPIMIAASEGSNGEGKLYISNLDYGVSNEDIKVLPCLYLQLPMWQNQMVLLEVFAKELAQGEGAMVVVLVAGAMVAVFKNLPGARGR
ncbi:RNA AND EXPORT FACTOR BINDING PROTEIN [Salix purpurea]|uniref:RNA AND EXPORT FACTOR BINDING PROTEIN n=1 Tax=Salix purpurea TaxID=77065 RepID=A0A9Q0Z1G1_SALPP|nr:RNA AND EXPORT FACTOR BINDING PROTEIN [Salix purpurea]